jgi:hypothetical protein
VIVGGLEASSGLKKDAIMRISQSQPNNQQKYPHLVSFNEESAKLFYSVKIEQVSLLEFLDHKKNPYRLGARAIEFLNLIAELNHRSGKGTYFSHQWAAYRLGVCKSTIKYWVKRYLHLGAITKTQVMWQGEWVNSYKVTPEFSKFTCPADGIIGACNRDEHSECVRPQISYTCTSCNRFRGGLSVEQQHNKAIDTLKNNLEQKINNLEETNNELNKTVNQLENEITYLKNVRAAKKNAKAEKSLSKAKAREKFLFKLKAEEQAVIKTYEAVTGRRFDVEKDLKAFNQLNKHAPVVAIIGVVQSAINLLVAKQAKEAKDYVLNGVDIKQAMEKAPIYSLKYCVNQVETVDRDFKDAFNKLGNLLIPSKTIMSYLGSTIATLDVNTTLELMGIIKAMPLEALGGKAGLKDLLGVFASKMVRRQIQAGLIEPEDHKEVFKEYFQSLLIEFQLKC